MLGIGGIGMSAIAQYLVEMGISVSGYDRSPSEITDLLKTKGVHITFNLEEKLSDSMDLVVYTPAIKEHPLFETAKTRNIPVLKRAELLSEICNQNKCLAVAGTHGKTTISSMLTTLLIETGCNPTAFLGGIHANLNSNFVKGNSDIVVVEADEFDRSFLKLKPFIGVISAVDADHLDIYQNEENVLSAFSAFSTSVNSNGCLIIENGVKNKINIPANVQVILYGNECGDATCSNVRYENGWSVFDYTFNDISIKGLKLIMPGMHNVLNAVAAITVAIQTGVSVANIPAALTSFKGVHRRFEQVLIGDTYAYIDDYAHHPVEIKAALNGARSLYPERELIAIFQPHLYTRTRDFAEGFAEALSVADKICLVDLYPAREKPIPGISEHSIGSLVSDKKVTYLNLQDIPEKIDLPEESFTLITLGAGNIGNKVHDIKNWLLRRKKDE